MKTISFLSGVFTLLPALISSKPIVNRDYSGDFTIFATSADDRVNLQPINANNNYFWIGYPTLTSCPVIPGLTCPPGNVTALNAGTNITMGISTSHEVPGMQSVFVRGASEPVPGALNFNSAHVAVPIDGITDMFNFNGTQLTYELGSWWACPAYGAFYVQSAGESPNDQCISIEISILPYTGPSPAAWEYD